MKAALARTFERPKISLSFWLALSSAFITFAIVSERTLFACSIALGALLLRSLSRDVSNTVRQLARSLFTFTAYLAALLPLWPEELSAFYFAPLALTIGVAALAAANRNSYGGSRGITAIVAVSFLLLVRNLVLHFEFKVPAQDLASAIAFISFLEIGLSNPYRKSDDSPHPDLAFGLILSLLASFHFTSLVLGFGLATLPLTAFLLRTHELSKKGGELARPTQLLTPLPRNRSFPLSYLTLLLPLILAALFYLLVLRIPFWADSLPRRAPSFAYSLAQGARSLSENSNLDDESAKSLSATLLNQKYIAEKVGQIAHRLTPNSYEKQPRTLSQSPTASERENQKAPSIASAPSQRNTAPYPSTKTPASPLPPSQDQPSQAESETSPTSERNKITDTTSATKTTHSDLPTTYAAAASNSPSSPAIDQPQEPFPSPEEQAETLADSSDFDQFLASFDRPETALSRTLNLEGSNISALLSEEPLVTAKLDSSRNAPKRLYLRRNVLDTVTNTGIDGIRGTQGRVEIQTSNDAIVPLLGFHQSASKGVTITITSNQRRHPTLPLPESCSSIQIFDTESIDIYPEDRVAIAPLSYGPISYRVFEADLEVTPKERVNAATTQAYRNRMLEIPLSAEDRSYLNSLAERIGGSRSSPRQFAYRISNYFENRHPYSYFVSIPSGPEHAVVRWLKNESAGLCSNYAAAFTLLARSRGIPTRVVGGFTSTEFDSSESRYVFRQNNAHAWVEFLDESNHWIRFDPTPTIEEAEMQRAQSYVTAASPKSLEKLIARETETTQSIAKASSPPSATQGKTSPKPVSTIELPPTEMPSAQGLDPQVGRTLVSAEKQSPPTEQLEAVPPIASPPTTIETPHTGTTPHRPAAETVVPPSRKSPPWLFILAILTLLVPSAVLLMRINKNHTSSPELQLRHQAGRLLTQLDALIQQHQLANDPIWIDVRDTLSAQRYGREANPVLVRDIAVKVGLLSKRKP